MERERRKGGRGGGMKRDRERCLTLESSPSTRKTRLHCCLAGNMSLKPVVAAEGHMSEDGRWESPAMVVMPSVLFWDTSWVS